MHTIDITAANSKAVFDFNEMGGPCFGPVHHINYQIREAGEYNNELDSLSNLNIDIPFGTTCAVELNNLSPENVTVTQGTLNLYHKSDAGLPMTGHVTIVPSAAPIANFNLHSDTGFRHRQVNCEF